MPSIIIIPIRIPDGRGNETDWPSHDHQHLDDDVQNPNNNNGLSTVQAVVTVLVLDLFSDSWPPFPENKSQADTHISLFLCPLINSLMWTLYGSFLPGNSYCCSSHVLVAHVTAVDEGILIPDSILYVKWKGRKESITFRVRMKDMRRQPSLLMNMKERILSQSELDRQER